MKIRKIEFENFRTYGTKVKKAMEYNKKGCTIQIIKEADFFATIKEEKAKCFLSSKV